MLEWYILYLVALEGSPVSFSFDQKGDRERNQQMESIQDKVFNACRPSFTVFPRILIM